MYEVSHYLHLQIKDEDNVDYIEEETLATTSTPWHSDRPRIHQIPTTPWHLDRIDQEDLPLDDSFSQIKTGLGVDIYILDTG